MSSPYRYTAQSYPTSHSYVDPYYTQKQPSPFIPNASLYPPSPYSSAPNTPGRNRVRFEDDLFPELNQRLRRPSWDGGQAPVMPPVAMPQPVYADPFLTAGNQGFPRRHSFSGPNQSLWANNSMPYAPWLYPPQPPSFQIHPFLNGESPRPEFYFDLSSPKFYPACWVGPGQVTPLTMEQLQEPATHPAITRLRIICDIIPQWPIDLEYNPYSQGGLNIPAPAVPISLGDILIALHRSLQNRISHIDWAKLTVSEETAVARAYTRRCKSIPSVSQFEASQGVRRVDYLLDRVMFKGLIRVPGAEGFETMKLIVG
jgi:hypothetical protein